MNTGQSLLTILAMVLLSVLVLRVNGTFLTTSTTLIDTKFGLLATSVAQSEINKITNLAFDQNSATANTNITNPTSFSTVLGKDAGETVDSTFNDVDDYNGYVSYDSSSSVKFKIVDSVCYVSDNNFTTPSSIRTWHKRITVYVMSDPPGTFMGDTIKVSTIFSYWYFN